MIGTRSTFRKLLWIGGVILGGVIIAAFVAVYFTPSPPPLAEVKLADGRIVRLAGVTVGEHHSMHSSSRLRNILFAFAPDGLKRQMGPNFNSSFGFQHHGIALWLMCYDPALKQYVPNAINKLVIVDEHGCELVNDASGATGDGYHLASVLQVDNFPRDQERLTFRMLSSSTGTNVLGEITIDNPARRGQEHWSPQTLPIAATNWPLAVRLNRIRPFLPQRDDVELFENGVPTKEWKLDDSFYIDPLGNSGRNRADPLGIRPHTLCRMLPAWKLKMRFSRSPRAMFRPEEIWKVGRVVIPASGNFTNIVLSSSVAGVPMKLKSFCGSGLFTLSNGVCTAGSPRTNGMSSSFSVTSARRGRANIRTAKWASHNPTLVVEHESLFPDRQFLARFWHEGKLVATAQGASADGENFYYELSRQVSPKEFPATNAPLEVEMEIIIQKSEEFEFLVDPKEYEPTVK